MSSLTYFPTKRRRDRLPRVVRAANRLDPLLAEWVHWAVAEEMPQSKSVGGPFGARQRPQPVYGLANPAEIN